jgi:phosphinothricin acetyltransferase
MIREATPADLPRLTDIYNEAIAEGGFTGDLDPLSLENRRAWFADHQAPYAVFVKTLDGAVAGYVALSPYRKGRRAFAGTCEISYYVARPHRGRGIGRELVRHALERAGALGFTTVLAIILESNGRSIELLRKAGFAISGRLPRVARVQGEYLDHLYLSRTLDAG